MALADIPILGSVLDGVKNMFPAYEEETVVSVHGNGYASKADLFKQAIAIAFGQNRLANFFNGVSAILAPAPAVLLSYNAPFYLQADYDMMGKSVTVTLRYMYNGMFSQPLGAGSNAFLDRFFKDLPSEDINTDAPNGLWFKLLGDEYKKTFNPGKMIATGDAYRVNNGSFPSNPVPGEETDQAGARGTTYMEQLVFALLATPCGYNSAWQVPNNGQLSTSPTDPTLTGYGGRPVDSSVSTVPTPSISSLLNQVLQSALSNAPLLGGAGFGGFIGSALSNAVSNPGSLTSILQGALGGLGNAVVDLFD